MNNKFIECIKNTFTEGISDAIKIDILIDDHKFAPKDLFMRFDFKEIDIVSKIRRMFVKDDVDVFGLFHFKNEESFTVDFNDPLDKFLMDEYNLTDIELHQLKRLDKELFNIMEDYFNASVNNIIYQNGSLNRQVVEEEVFESVIYEHDDKIKELSQELYNEGLKCCPLCKNKVKIYFNADSQYIECPKCGLETKTFVSEKDLVKYWNRRD